MDNRFLPEDERDKKTYQIQRVWDHHRSILRMLVASNGKVTNKEIGEAVGCSAQTVSNVRNDPVTQEILAGMHREADTKAIDVSRKVKEMFPLAAKVLENVMMIAEDPDTMKDIDSKVLSQSVRAAITVTDHAHPKTSRVQAFHGHVTMAELNALKQSALGEIKEVQAEVETVDNQ